MSLKAYTAENLAYLARNGGGMEISARAFTADNLAYIARNAVGTGARIVIRDTGGLTLDNLAFIARNGGGAVVFQD